LKYEKTNHNLRCSHINRCRVYDTPPATRLDPSF
jgi:hypothetical protein